MGLATSQAAGVGRAVAAGSDEQFHVRTAISSPVEKPPIRLLGDVAVRVDAPLSARTGEVGTASSQPRGTGPGLAGRLIGDVVR